MIKGQPTAATMLVEDLFGLKDKFLLRIDKALAFGSRWTSPTGEVWQLVGQNDLHVPYFCKVRKGRVQKTRHTMSRGEEIAQQLLKERLWRQ